MRYQLLFSTDKWHSRMEYLRQVTPFIPHSCLLRLGNLLAAPQARSPTTPSGQLLRAGLGTSRVQLWHHDGAEPRGPGLHPHHVRASRWKYRYFTAREAGLTAPEG